MAPVRTARSGGTEPDRVRLEFCRIDARGGADEHRPKRPILLARPIARPIRDS
jgi:hypothetical protein